MKIGVSGTDLLDKLDDINHVFVRHRDRWWHHFRWILVSEQIRGLRVLRFVSVVRKWCLFRNIHRLSSCDHPEWDPSNGPSNGHQKHDTRSLLGLRELVVTLPSEGQVWSMIPVPCLKYFCPHFQTPPLEVSQHRTSTRSWHVLQRNFEMKQSFKHVVCRPPVCFHVIRRIPEGDVLDRTRLFEFGFEL